MNVMCVHTWLSNLKVVRVSCRRVEIESSGLSHTTAAAVELRVGENEGQSMQDLLRKSRVRVKQVY